MAFRATLEELEDADLLLHVIDISNPHHLAQIDSVEQIVSDLNLGNATLLRVLNKTDLVNPAIIQKLSRTLNGTAISAKQKSTLLPLIHRMETFIESIRRQ